MTLCEFNALSTADKQKLFENFCGLYDLDINDKTAMIAFRAAYHLNDTEVVA
jgi:hypothetical protein